MFLLADHIAGIWCMAMLNPGSLPTEAFRVGGLQVDSHLSGRTMDQDAGEQMKATQKAFLKMLDDYQRIIYKVCRVYANTRNDQQDLFQEIVHELWRSFPSFRNESQPGTWVYRVALNTAMIPYRRQVVKIELLGELPDITAAEESGNNFFDLLQSLNATDRGLLTLQMEGYRAKEIASMLGMGEEAVKKRLARMKEKLQNSML